MLAADLESTALRIGCANQELHFAMNSCKRELGLSHDVYFFPQCNYCNVGKIEIYLVEEIKQHGNRQKIQVNINYYGYLIIIIYILFI